MSDVEPNEVERLARSLEQRAHEPAATSEDLPRCVDPTAAAAAVCLRTLSAQLEAEVARANKAEANYRFMVEKAADQKLDGYRELGTRAARAENERDLAQGELQRLRDALQDVLARPPRFTDRHMRDAADSVVEEFREVAAKVGAQVASPEETYDPSRSITLEQLFQGFEREIDAAFLARSRQGKGGQQVSFHGDFASASPSTLGRLRWWLREFREAFKRQLGVPLP